MGFRLKCGAFGSAAIGPVNSADPSTPETNEGLVFDVFAETPIALPTKTASSGP
jgi:hypothetical protein